MPSVHHVPVEEGIEKLGRSQQGGGGDGGAVPKSDPTRKIAPTMITTTISRVRSRTDPVVLVVTGAWILPRQVPLVIPNLVRS